ncbi:MAG: cytochrome P450 [Enhygromyxa sp.]
MIPSGPQKPVALEHETLATLRALAAEYGGIVTVGPKVYLVTDPDLIEEILVARPGNFKKGRSAQRMAAFLGRGSLLLEGEAWRKRRRLVQPAFSRTRLESMGPMVVAVTEAHLSTWSDRIDAHEAFVALLMDLTVRHLFNQDVVDEMHQLVTAWKVLYAHMSNRFIDLDPSTEVLEARRQVDDILWRLITRRREHGDDGSLLARMVTARDDDGSRMTDEELRDEVMTLFVGGYETGATAMTFTMAFLSKHGDVAARHLEEVRGRCGERAVDYPDLAAMPLNYWILQESMRLAPPSWMITREMIEGDTVGGYELEAGSQLLISPWVVHRDPRWWPEPERFDPDRFAPEMSASRPRMAWMPFGGGPRKCLGFQLALIELQLILATLVRRVKLTLIAEELIPVARLGLGSTEPAIMTVARM